MKIRNFAVLAAFAFTVCDFCFPTSALTRAKEMPEWSAPVNLGPKVNSRFEDILPHQSKNGLSLYFTSNRRVGFPADFDIYVSQRANRDDPWGEPKNLGPNINTGANDRSSYLSRDGHFLFIASNRPGGFGSQDVYVSYREQTHDDFGWQPPVNLGAGVNGPDNDFGAAYFENDDIGIPNIMFGSRRDEDGDEIVNDSDIYLSELLADGSFGPAVLITELSSPYDDQRPAIRPNGLEVFFNSDRPDPPNDPESGDVDLWSSTRESVFEPWSTPVNMGPIINTDESIDLNPTLSSDGETLVFSSNRPGGVGGPDLYVSSREKHD